MCVSVTGRLSCVVAGLCLALGLATTPVDAGGERPLVLRADVQVAGFRTHQKLHDALVTFGRPTSMHAVRGALPPACKVVWSSLGLVMRFLGPEPGCSQRSFFGSAVATGSRWETTRRLHIGDPVGRLRARYPGAHSTPSGHGVRAWALFRRGKSHAGLTAITKHGRVVELIVSAAVSIDFG